MEMHADTGVLIVGAGPTGLVMAIELLRRGVSCRVVDKNSGPADHSRAIAVQARTMELFEAMGVVKDVRAAGVANSAFVVATGGKERATVVLDGIVSPYPYIFLLPQDRTERILLARLAALGGHVERETRLNAFAQDTDGVTATLVGANGATETVRARYVVGCDGAHSAVRHALGVPFAGGAYDDTLWLADVQVDGNVRRDALLLCLGDADAFIALIPIDAEGRFRAIVRPHDRDIAAAPTLPVIQAVLDALAPTKLTLRDPTWLSAFRLHHRKAARFRVGRVFLAGDAAHIHSPIGGQGMNTGIQDAANLAWKLAFALRGVAAPALLDSYHRERDAVAERLLRTTDTGFELLRSRNPLVRSLRNILVARLLPLKTARRRMTANFAQVGIRYASGAATVRDPGGAGVKTGLRAPDGPLVGVGTNGEATRLMPVLAAEPGRYTLLLFGGTSPTAAGNAALARLAAQVREQSGAFVAPVWIAAGNGVAPDVGDMGDAPFFTDPAGAIHRTYGAKGATAYLVRPDGYIAYRGHATDGRTAKTLLAHLGGVFLPAVQRESVRSGTLVA